jgi:hypothetical protein
MELLGNWKIWGDEGDEGAFGVQDGRGICGVFGEVLVEGLCWTG